MAMTLSGSGTIAVASGSNAISITSTNQVNTPVQVCFSAIATSNYTNTTVIYNTVYVNIGSGYNSSTGIFTAPEAGVYLFTTNGLANGGQGDMQLQINGTNRSSCRGNSTTASMTLIYSMSAGDTAKVVVNGTQIYGDSSGWSLFTGRLLG